MIECRIESSGMRFAEVDGAGRRRDNREMNACLLFSRRAIESM